MSTDSSLHRWPKAVRCASPPARRGGPNSGLAAVRPDPGSCESQDRLGLFDPLVDLVQFDLFLFKTPTIRNRRTPPSGPSRAKAPRGASFVTCTLPKRFGAVNVTERTARNSPRENVRTARSPRRTLVGTCADAEAALMKVSVPCSTHYGGNDQQRAHHFSKLFHLVNSSTGSPRPEEADQPGLIILLCPLGGFCGIFERHRLAFLQPLSTTMSVSLRLPTSIFRISNFWPFCT